MRWVGEGGVIKQVFDSWNLEFRATRLQTQTVGKLICLYCRTQERLTGRAKWKAIYTPVPSSTTNPPPPGAQRAATATKGGGHRHLTNHSSN